MKEVARLSYTSMNFIGEPDVNGFCIYNEVTHWYERVDWFDCGDEAQSIYFIYIKEDSNG